MRAHIRTQPWQLPLSSQFFVWQTNMKLEHRRRSITVQSTAGVAPRHSRGVAHVDIRQAARDELTSFFSRYILCMFTYCSDVTRACRTRELVWTSQSTFSSVRDDYFGGTRRTASMYPYLLKQQRVIWACINHELSVHGKVKQEERSAQERAESAVHDRWIASNLGRASLADLSLAPMPARPRTCSDDSNSVSV